jgi:hypothetical protein
MRERQEAEQRQWDRVAAQQAESEEEEEEGREQQQQQQQQQQRGAQAQAAPARPQQQGAAAAAGAGAAGGPSQGAAAAAAAEEKEGEEDAGAAAAGAISYIRIPPEEAAEYSEALLDAMRQRFLAGQDAGVDYAAIDAGGCWREQRWEAGRGWWVLRSSGCSQSPVPRHLASLICMPMPPHLPTPPSLPACLPVCLPRLLPWRRC